MRRREQFTLLTEGIVFSALQKEYLIACGMCIQDVSKLFTYGEFYTEAQPHLYESLLDKKAPRQPLYKDIFDCLIDVAYSNNQQIFALSDKTAYVFYEDCYEELSLVAWLSERGYQQ